MLPFNSQSQTGRPRDSAQVLSAFMSSVYLWMMVGIAISGVTAFVVASRPDVVMTIMKNPVIFYGLIIAQLAAVIGLSAFVQRMSVAMASFIYVSYATLVGLTFSTLFLAYTAASISSAFFVTAFSFAGLSVFGYTTKKDLGPIGSFCMMGLFGLIGIMILGMFIPSMMGDAMQLTISVVGLIVFAGLTAYDTQRIKALQFQYATADQSRKGSIYGALILYLDFINLFLNILRLMGDRR
jgi:FtsH-binding integral membrane protein